jgi:hypothetical protein
VTARIGRAALALVLGAALALLGGGPAAAQGSGERVASFHLDAMIRSDGSLEVTEEISYDFGANQRHGIERELDTRERYDDEHDRVYALTDVTVYSASGAPDAVQLISNTGSTTIRIGDPALTVSGRQRYELHYVLRGLMNSFDDHDELYWEATGTRWRVPMSDLAVMVHAPGPVQRTACFAGDPSSKAGCDQTQMIDERQVAFRQRSVAVGDGLTVVVGLAKGAVAVPPPVLDSTGRAPWSEPPTGLSYLVAGLVVVATAVGGWLLWSRAGRDRRFAGLPLGLTPAPGQGGAEEYVPVGGGPEPAVAFTPPKGIRPALAGLLLTERTAPMQISATIVDLAVRGYLRIEELPGRDWQLTWLGERSPDDQLARYERVLLDSLFQGAPAVRLSDLNQHFRTRYRQVSTELADDGFRAGWFRRRPSIGGVTAPRQLVGCLGVLVFLPISFGGVGSVLALAGAGWSAVVVAAGVLVALAVALFVWRAMPARTALGRAMWAQVVGFRRYLATAEADQLRHEEAASVFSRYLPLAMIFGLTRRWATVFAQLAAAQGTFAAVTWYVGDPSTLGPSLDHFGRGSGSALSASTPSSSGGSGLSGGSVGGGGGGGGGGSW